MADSINNSPAQQGLGDKTELLDTFNNKASPLGTTNNTRNGVVDTLEIETFDNFSEVKVPTKKEETNQNKKYNEPDKKSQVDLLEDKEELNAKEKELKDEAGTKKDAGKSDSEEKQKVDESKPDEQKPEPKQAGGKAIKARMGDQDLELSPETEFRQKIDGKYETVKLRDLLNQKAGSVTIERRMTELGKEKKQFVEEKSKYSAEKDQVIKHLSTISKLMDDEQATPFDVLNYLVDISGRDTLSYQKKVMDYLNTELNTLSNMTDDEQKLYWKDREIQSLRKAHEASTTRSKEHQVRQERASAVDKMRETHGVSQEQFIEAYDALAEKVGEGKFTAEQVIEEAKMLPHNAKARTLTAPFEEDLSSDEFGSLVKEVARISKEFPHFNDEEMLVNAAKKLGLDVQVIDENEEALKSKLQKQPNYMKGTPDKKVYKGRVSKVDDEEIEMFSED